ncbi:MAG TPA: TonB-dependent hemoglobin/transferrin/lactoferrin family receptor [Kaistia sp.]|nr:TonB-dependent hemoglobin/transferrin/lactoferrin family receptor [Kaistia sp.]
MSIARLNARLLAGSTFLACLAMTAGSAMAQQASAQQAQAQQTTGDGAVQLDAVVVQGGSGSGATTGDQTPAVTAKEGTALVTTTTQQELTNRMIDSWQAFGQRAEPGVSFSTQNNSINVRGLDENNVLTTIDGIRLPWLGSGDARSVTGGLSTFDFNALSAIDIVRGADSSIGGSGAMGGLVALTTLSADDVIREGRNWGFITKNIYASANNSFTTSDAVAARFGDTSMLVQGSYTTGHETETMGDVGGYGTTRTEANPEDFDQYSLLGKLTQRFDGGHSLTLTGEMFHGNSTTDAMSSQSLTGNYRPGNYTTGEEARRQRFSLTYDYLAPEPGGFADKAQAILYWQNLELDNTTDAYRSTSVIGPYQRQNSNQVQEFGLNGFAEKALTLGGFENRFTWGGEFYLTDTSQYSYGVDNCPPNAKTSPCSMLHTNQADMPDAQGATFGIYGRDEVALGNNLFLTPGLRFDWYQQVPQETAGYGNGNEAYIGLPDTSSGSKFSPSLLGTWKATDKLSFYAQWAQAYTAPTPGQLYLTYGGPGAYLSIGNPDLEAQSGTGYEIGTKFGDDQLGGGISAFTNFYKNFIDSEQLTAAEAAARGYDLAEYPFGVSEYVNINSVNIYGVEARGAWKFAPNWKLSGSLAWMVGQNLDEGTYLDSVPPLKGVIGIGYADVEWGTDLMLTAAAMNAQTSASFQAPAYAVVDWTAWWQPAKLPGLRVQAGVFNLFDETYFNNLDIPTSVTASSSNLDFYSEPGRNYQVNLTYQF